ncbi:MAG: ATP-binding protein [Bacteroidales bacterium]|nr:ATP-binding protein [Bacteroidales bacterium]
MGINNITGPPVEGDDFFGREKELEFAWGHIKKGNSLLLSAPRRVGKSSFAKKLLEYAREDNWNTLELNLEEVKTEEGFVKLFIEKIQEECWWLKAKEKTNNTIANILESIKPTFKIGDVESSVEWKIQKADIYNKLKTLIDHKEETLIMVDEVTILLNSFIKIDKENGINDVVFFLNWLRSFRQVTGTKIHWIFCSSIGIENFTSRHNLSYTLNDVSSLQLSEFTKEQATNFIKELAISENLKIEDVHITYMLDKLVWNLPYFIQILFLNIDKLVKIHGKTISEQTINEAYQTLISEKHLNTWDERLNEYGEFESYTRLLLKNLSKTKEGESRDNLYNMLYAKINDGEKTEIVLNKLLYMLKNDGYLIDTEDSRYTFRSPLLRDFWYNRFSR